MISLPGKTVGHERLKLRASAMNALAVASVVGGFITPIVAATFGLGASSDRDAVRTVAAALVWLGMACSSIILPGGYQGASGMTGSQTVLLFLGPTLALVAGLATYGLHLPDEARYRRLSGGGRTTPRH